MSERSLGWDLEFDEPIALERGGKLVTLRDATNYITALPANEAALPEWQAAIVADLSGPTMFARIGVMRALNRHRFERMSAPARSARKLIGLSRHVSHHDGEAAAAFVPVPPLCQGPRR
jgi:hypothetical protein